MSCSWIRLPWRLQKVLSISKWVCYLDPMHYKTAGLEF